MFLQAGNDLRQGSASCNIPLSDVMAGWAVTKAKVVSKAVMQLL